MIGTMRRARELVSASFGAVLGLRACATRGAGAGTGTRGLWGVVRASIAPDGSRCPSVRTSRRRWARAAIAVLAALVVVATATTVATADTGPVAVRVAARTLATGSVEFAVQQQADSAWGERQLPGRRFFPADTSVGRWLVSSPVELASTTLRVAARKLADGRVEFAVQQRIGGAWGERRLPTRRFFPADTAVGRWLVSSPLTFNAADSQSSPSSAATGGSSDCAPFPDHVPQHTRERLCLPEVGANTFRVFYSLAEYHVRPAAPPCRLAPRVLQHERERRSGQVFYTIVSFNGLQEVRRGSVPGERVDACMDNLLLEQVEEPGRTPLRRPHQRADRVGHDRNARRGLHRVPEVARDRLARPLHPIDAIPDRSADPLPPALSGVAGRLPEFGQTLSVSGWRCQVGQSP